LEASKRQLPPAASSVVLVDTNILVYLMIEGDRTPAAQELYERDADWRSEAFVMVEFSNVLATYVRSKALTYERAIKLLEKALALVPMLTNVMHAQVLETAAQFGISAYDARFITLAEQMRAKLVTEDIKLQVAVPSWTVSLAGAVAC
jgi:predicted nucleic acid-binding protein